MIFITGWLLPQKSRRSYSEASLAQEGLERFWLVKEFFTVADRSISKCTAILALTRPLCEVAKAAIRVNADVCSAGLGRSSVQCNAIFALDVSLKLPNTSLNTA